MNNISEQQIREEAEREWQKLLNETAPLLLSDKLDNEAFSWKGGYIKARLQSLSTQGEPQGEVCAFCSGRGWIPSLNGIDIEPCAICELSEPQPKETAEQGWISVEERLPEENQQVIWFYKNGGMHIGVGQPDITSPYTLVTHWQPLPSLPTGRKASEHPSTDKQQV